MPTTAQYRKALKVLDAKLAPTWRELLRRHWAAPRHTTSMALLARAVKYKNYRAANLNYGRLAAKIGSLVGIPPSEDYVNLHALATWKGTKRNFEGHFTFQMRPQLARALKSEGWVAGAKPPREPTNPAAWLEGEERKLFRLHRSRDAQLREAKLREVLEKTGRLRCEVPGCGFEFEHQYGDLGHGFAEVHHLVPLRQLRRPRKNRLADVAVVCSNCHSMIHRHGNCRPLSKVVPTKSNR
jgi:predicted HNH restriction endonuclease